MLRKYLMEKDTEERMKMMSWAPGFPVLIWLWNSKTCRTRTCRPNREATWKDVEAGEITNPLVFRLPSTSQETFISFSGRSCLLLTVRYFQSTSRRLADGKAQILVQLFPSVLALGIGFMEDNFSTDPVGGWFRGDSSTLHLLCPSLL